MKKERAWFLLKLGSPVTLTAKPSAYGGSRMSPVLSSATILQASEIAATQPNSTTIDSPRPSAFCTAAPPGKINYGFIEIYQTYLQGDADRRENVLIYLRLGRKTRKRECCQLPSQRGINN